MRIFILFFFLLSIIGCSQSPAKKAHNDISQGMTALDQNITNSCSEVSELKKLSGERDTSSCYKKQPWGKGRAFS